MIFSIFSPKNLAKKLAFLSQNKAKLCKNLIITLVFEKNANLFAENCRKSQKIVINIDPRFRNATYLKSNTNYPLFVDRTNMAYDLSSLLEDGTFR
jgi:hypothetical protein